MLKCGAANRELFAGKLRAERPGCKRYVDMKRLRAILEQYSQPLVMGSVEDLNVEALKADLASVSKRDKKSVFMRILLQIILFIGSAFMVWKWRGEPERVSLVFTASGITISWLFKSILELWEEKTASETTLILVVKLNEDYSRSIIEALSKNIGS
jgi:hypothetical protein